MIHDCKNCPLCLELFQNPLISKCGHRFCEKCIRKALKSSPNCPVCEIVIDLENLIPNLDVESLQKQIELTVKNNSESLKDLNKKKLKMPTLSNVIISEFFTMLETEKLTEFTKVKQQLERITQLKNSLEIETKTAVIGSKRKASDVYFEKDDERISKLKENFTSLSESFSEHSDWESLSRSLQSCTKLYKVFEIASFRNGDGLSTASQIISSIESDRKGHFFATAGVSKQINVFNLDEIVETPRIRSDPVLKIQCDHKVSCLSWNPFYDNKLCSADYDGILNLYDANNGKLCTTWNEHEKRCWSVDTSSISPQNIITGSDDFQVKLWNLKSPKSVHSWNIRANVCSVKFSPKDSNVFAVGSADHRVLLFDLRKPSVPIFAKKQHSKSVSYVRFANLEGNSLISASTDSTVKLWSQDNHNTWNNSKTFQGHSNEKNFVGLSVLENGLIATGSEDNSVVIYDQNLDYPVLRCPMMTTCPLTGKLMADELGTFVSSVSWANRPDKFGNSMLLIANSTGNIKIVSIIEE